MWLQSHVEKNEQGRAKAAVLKKSCVQDWPLVGMWDFKRHISQGLQGNRIDETYLYVDRDLLLGIGSQDYESLMMSAKYA